MAKSMTHEQLKRKALSDSDVKAEYDALEEEFALLNEMIKARHSSHKTQSDIAKAMGTTTSVVGRLETGGGKNRHSPSLATLRRYANAIGFQLKIKLVPKKARP